MNQGKFFVIDGTDGSGKETQTKLLLARMRREGYAVETVSFPQYGKKSAGPTEEYLAGKYGPSDRVGPKPSSVFYAVDRYDASHDIRAWLESGRHVIADRYVSSNMGHQGGKIDDPEERRHFFEWNDELEHGIFGIPRPDLTIVLHVPAEVNARLMADRPKDIHEQDMTHLKRAERTYLELVELFPGFRLIECVDGSGILMSPERIHEMVWEIIRPMLG